VQQHELEPEDDTVLKVVVEEGKLQQRMTIGFNGPATLAWKLGLAHREGLAGMMVWEVRGGGGVVMVMVQVGQDCRVVPVVRGETVHRRTCPGEQVTGGSGVTPPRARRAACCTRSTGRGAGCWGRGEPGRSSVGGSLKICQRCLVQYEL
jgi:hypothetical protein